MSVRGLGFGPDHPLSGRVIEMKGLELPGATISEVRYGRTRSGQGKNGAAHGCMGRGGKWFLGSVVSEVENDVAKTTCHSEWRVPRIKLVLLRSP